METVDIIIAGAGIAGLTAARRLRQAGKSVLVLEARDRVGGRTMEGRLLDQPFDLGGQWIGPEQKRVNALCKELGLKVFPQFARGKQLMEMGGRIKGYEGVIPRLPIWSLLSADRAIKEINRLATELDPTEPWAWRHAREFDGLTFEDWIRARVSTGAARELLRIASRAILSAEPAEVSMLFFLSYVRAAGTFEQLADVEGAAQQDRILGGAFQIARRLADELPEDAVRLDAPVELIAQDDAGVLVRAKGLEARARLMIIAMSPIISLGLNFAPSRPIARDNLARRMPMGSVTKFIAAYEKPFWRERGLSGMVASDMGPAGPVFDAGIPDDPRGFLVGFLEGEEGRRFALADEASRRGAVLECLGRWFGPLAANPIAYVEKNWTADPWSGGCYTGIAVPGTLANYGHALREPFGRIHWAGTETAVEWMGYFEGAIESGERSAGEVLKRLSA